MVRKRLLVPLIATAEILVVVGYTFLVVPPAFLVPCPEHGEGGGHGISSPAPSPAGSSGCEEAGDCISLRVPFGVFLAVCCVVGYITRSTGTRCYTYFIDDEEEEKVKVAGSAKKVGYVAIAGGDLEAAGAGKN